MKVEWSKILCWYQDCLSITIFHVRERMHFVDQIVPEDVTHISTIKDMEEYEVEEEEEEMLKSKVAEQLFTPHPRFPCLSETVSC